MTIELAMFYAFSLVTVLSAGAVVTLRNPVHAVLSLILCFFSTACLWLLLQAEFLGIALVLVYVGAVMILFLFVVMMLDLNLTPIREGFARYFPVAVLVAAVMLFEIVGLIGVRASEGMRAMAAADPAQAAGLSNLEWIGQSLFTRFMLPFEIAAVILTVAIVVAVMLTLRRREGTKHQDPSRQVMVRREDRVRLVKMKSEPMRREGEP
ncbi:MAG TPA: NADH-quinone oxidoreductase subunit J [Roseateles sp.]|jgi:NADH-quinone oxidoreductase subunit J|nr:NADH-quinone oxidoreductase subunit J [Roseateles sp.]